MYVGRACGRRTGHVGEVDVDKSVDLGGAAATAIQDRGGELFIALALTSHYWIRGAIVPVEKPFAYGCPTEAGQQETKGRQQ